MGFWGFGVLGNDWSIRMRVFVEEGLALVVVELEAVAKIAIELNIMIVYYVWLLNLREGRCIISRLLSSSLLFLFPQRLPRPPRLS